MRITISFIRVDDPRIESINDVRLEYLFQPLNMLHEDFGVRLEGETIPAEYIRHPGSRMYRHSLVYDAAKYQVYATVDYGHNIDDTSDYAVIDIVVNQKKCLGILVSQD